MTHRYQDKLPINTLQNLVRIRVQDCKEPFTDMQICLAPNE
jgi:hypothetical protein